MLVNLAVGDSYGAGFEFVPDKVVADHAASLKYRQHPKHPRPLGSYTDDTQMALALAELMLDKEPDTWTMFDVAKAFVKGYLRDPRTGYAGGFHKLLETLRVRYSVPEGTPELRIDIATVEFLSTVRPHSFKSGGAMRAAPLGLLPDKVQVRDLAMMQASVTHATHMGMAAAAAAALMTHYTYYRVGEVARVGEWMDSELPGWMWGVPWSRRVESEAYQHVRAAIRALTANTTLSEVLIGCISFGGDVDTVAAIAMPAATFSEEITADLPQHLYDELENGDYGRDYLRDVSRNLRLRFKRPPTKAAAAQDDLADFHDLFG